VSGENAMAAEATIAALDAAGLLLPRNLHRRSVATSAVEQQS
jgi:hypothetical protein